jgi:hypothetical protein
MNKEVVTIGGGVLGAMVSNGASALLPQSESPIINIAMAGASVFGATKVAGTTTKANVLKGALIGSAIVQTLIAVKKIANKNLAAKFTGTGKGTEFAKAFVGLGCPDDQHGLHGVEEEEGLHGQFLGQDGKLYEVDATGLSGTYMDENGNVFQTNDGLNGAEEEEGLHGVEEEEGLHGIADVYGEENFGLQGAESAAIEELYQ